MSQRAYYSQADTPESRPRLELVAQPDFEQEFKELLDYVQDAGEHLGRCPEVTEAEQGAAKYASRNWPNGAVVCVTLPAGSEVYDHLGYKLDNCPEVFRSDYFAGFDMGKARFINLGSSQSVRVSDIRQAQISVLRTPPHEGANYE